MILSDASVLVALLNNKDPKHNRCIETLPLLSPPLVTTAYCFAEAMHLLGRLGWYGQQPLWKLFCDRRLEIYHNHDDDLLRMNVLMEQYQDVPMDVADASLVVTAENLNETKIFTLDRDFYVYRLFGNQAFEVLPGLVN